jgi:predicted secreted protein
VGRVITAADDGGSVRLKRSQKTIAVALVGIPTAGFVWTPQSVPAFLTPGDKLTGRTTKAQLQPGFTGGRHWEVMVFRVTGPGSGRLTLVQRRPWEPEQPPIKTFTVDVTAAAK